MRKRYGHGLGNRPGLGRRRAAPVVDDAHHIGIALVKLSAEIIEINGGNALDNLGQPDASHHLLLSDRVPPFDAQAIPRRERPKQEVWAALFRRRWSHWERSQIAADGLSLGVTGAEPRFADRQRALKQRACGRIVALRL